MLLGVVFVGLSNWFSVWQPQVVRQALDTVIDATKYYREHGGLASHPEALKEVSTQVAWFGVKVIVLALLMGVFMFFKYTIYFLNNKFFI